METVSVCPLRSVSGCFWTRAMDDVEFCALTIRRWYFKTCICARSWVLARFMPTCGMQIEYTSTSKLLLSVRTSMRVAMRAYICVVTKPDRVQAPPD